MRREQNRKRNTLYRENYQVRSYILIYIFGPFNRSRQSSLTPCMFMQMTCLNSYSLLLKIRCCHVYVVIWVKTSDTEIQTDYNCGNIVQFKMHEPSFPYDLLIFESAASLGNDMRRGFFSLLNVIPRDQLYFSANFYCGEKLDCTILSSTLPLQFNLRCQCLNRDPKPMVVFTVQQVSSDQPMLFV